MLKKYYDSVTKFKEFMKSEEVADRLCMIYDTDDLAVELFGVYSSLDSIAEKAGFLAVISAGYFSETWGGGYSFGLPATVDALAAIKYIKKEVMGKKRRLDICAYDWTGEPTWISLFK